MKKTILALMTSLALLGACTLPFNQAGTIGQSPNGNRAVSAGAAVDPFEMVQRLGTGINMGNTLDAPTEGAWAAVAQEYYFDDYKATGFDSVRIPITWDKHLGITAPYTIDPAFLARVTTIVNWALARDLAVVINCHHEDWIRTDYPAAMVPRLESLWNQIATNFAGYSENLVFEIMNEPNGNITKAQVDDMNSRILGIIRQTNPTRNVIISGRWWNGYATLISEVAIPADSHLIANFHFYDPWYFCGEKTGTWGSAQDIADMANAFKKVKDWSLQKNIPVYVGEYGVLKEADAASRITWYQNFCGIAASNGFATAAWDDSGWFGIYNRSGRSWETAVIAAIFGSTPTPTDSPPPNVDGVTVKYSKNDWGSGFTGTIKLTNTTSQTVNNWKLVFSFAGNQTITNYWNTVLTQSGTTVSASGVGWNSSIAPNSSVEFGFNANYVGTNADPAKFVVSY